MWKWKLAKKVIHKFMKRITCTPLIPEKYKLITLNRSVAQVSMKNQGSEGVYISKEGQTDSTDDEEEEEYEKENSSEDHDYEEEMSSEYSDEYASVDSESVNVEHLTGKSR